MSETADIVAACRALHSAIDRLDQVAADTIGVSRNDLRCLNLLEHGSLAPSRIAEHLSLTSGSITALLDRLERLNLIERRRDPGDRRALLVSATPLVFEKLGPVYRAFAEELRRAAAALSPAQQQLFIGHLELATQVCNVAVANSRA